EAPALVMIFFALMQLCRQLGADARVAALVALAACVARPFISQTILAKDDLFVAAFFLAAVVGLSQQRLRDSLGSWRLGTAIGLLLATKYTALFSAPILFLAIDAPVRASWRRRQYLIALFVAIAIACPWYLRNWILYQNPLFPVEFSVFGARIFPGMF